MPKYLMPMARCRETQQIVKSNDLSSKFTPTQLKAARLQSQRLADQMQIKTGKTWVGFVQEYSVDSEGRTGL